MDIRRLKSLFLKERVVKAGEEHTGHGNDGTFVAAALLDAVILDPEIRVLLVLDGS